jgi:hypothetical protein
MFNVFQHILMQLLKFCLSVCLHVCDDRRHWVCTLTYSPLQDYFMIMYKLLR